MNNYTIELVERMIFTLPYEMQPFDIIRDVEKFLGVKNCVFHLVAYMGNKYTLTICSSDAVEKLRSRDKLLIGKKKVHYQLSEKGLTRVKILQPPAHLRSNNIDSSVRRYGKILYSDLGKRASNSWYFAIVDLKKPLPDKISLKRRMCDVLSY